MLIKAHRFSKGLDFYNLMAPVLKTITREEETRRVRDIKPGEQVQSLWDVLHSPETKFMVTTEGEGSDFRPQQPTLIMYNESDAREDEVLFPEELQEGQIDATVRDQFAQKMHALENEGPSLARFIYDLDTDEDFTDDEAEQESKQYEEDYLSDVLLDVSDSSENEYEDEELTNDLADMEMSPDAQKMLEIIRGGKENVPEMMERLKNLMTPRPLREADEVVKEDIDIFIDRQRAASKSNSILPNMPRSYASRK